MKLLLVFAALVVASQAASFDNVQYGKGCKYPNWKCDCGLYYNCAETSGFPDVEGDADNRISGLIKDLAPDDYQLRIPGKRWRREIWSQEEFCKRECNDRLNAFLCLNPDGTLSQYSHFALCTKFLSFPAREEVGDPILNGPFFQTGNDNAEGCCEVWLQWGLDWCPRKWSRPLGGLRCYTDNSIVFAGTASGSVSLFFTAVGCDVDTSSNVWCSTTPTCPT